MSCYTYFKLWSPFLRKKQFFQKNDYYKCFQHPCGKREVCLVKFLTQLWSIANFSKCIAGQTGAFISCQYVFVMLGPLPHAQLHTEKILFDFCFPKCLTIT